ncbi:MAG: LysE family translocator [Pseudomonadota bacterium]
MSIDVWFAFAAACVVVLMIPGPTILLVCSYALSAGRRAGLWMVFGVAMGDLVAMTASVLGLGALLLSSAELFTLLRWIGAAYLLYLGWKLWRAPVDDATRSEAPRLSGPKMALHAFAVTATNPKGIIFFVAFVPQFIDPASALAPQLTVMVATFVGLAALNAGFFALLADKMGQRIARPSVRRAVNRVGGGALMAMGVLAALSKRA